MTDAPKPAPTIAERSMLALETIASCAVRIAEAQERLAPAPAPVVDLDDKNGDPTVRFNPRGWHGPGMKGSTFSRTSPDFLEALATAFDSMAATETEAKGRHFKRLDAARARGWAQRLRDGWKPKALTLGGNGTPAPSGTSSPSRTPASSPTPAMGADASTRYTAAQAASDYPPDWDDVPELDDLDTLKPL